jgi:hypothetical protein
VAAKDFHGNAGITTNLLTFPPPSLCHLAETYAPPIFVEFGRCRSTRL